MAISDVLNAAKNERNRAHVNKVDAERRVVTRTANIAVWTSSCCMAFVAIYPILSSLRRMAVRRKHAIMHGLACVRGRELKALLFSIPTIFQSACRGIAYDQRLLQRPARFCSRDPRRPKLCRGRSVLSTHDLA